MVCIFEHERVLNPPGPGGGLSTGGEIGPANLPRKSIYAVNAVLGGQKEAAEGTG